MNPKSFKNAPQTALPFFLKTFSLLFSISLTIRRLPAER